jgi:hypothetical protein
MVKTVSREELCSLLSLEFNKNIKKNISLTINPPKKTEKFEK